VEHGVDVVRPAFEGAGGQPPAAQGRQQGAGDGGLAAARGRGRHQNLWDAGGVHTFSFAAVRIKTGFSARSRWSLPGPPAWAAAIWVTSGSIPRAPNAARAAARVSRAMAVRQTRAAGLAARTASRMGSSRPRVPPIRTASGAGRPCRASGAVPAVTRMF